MKIYKRSIIDHILPYLGDETIIVLHGARQVGKTHILYYLRDHLLAQNKTLFFYDLEYPELLETLNQGTNVFMEDLVRQGYQKDSKAYVFIDEIQYLDKPSSFLKIIADHHKNIHLIVSGSSSFDIKTKFTDSLVGRTTNFEIFPLNFAEFLAFREKVLIPTPTPSPAGLKEFTQLYTEFIRYGGYPQVVLEPIVEKKHKNLLQIIDTYIRKDIRDLATISDIQKFNNLLKLLSYQSGQLISYNALCTETKLTYPTLQKYLTLLEETYIIKLVHPYSHNPSIEISKNPKIFFLDSGLQSILWLNQFSSVLLGNILETNIFGELIKKYGRMNVHFWRTKNGTEIDFIVTGQGSPIAIEVKVTFPPTIPHGMTLFLSKYPPSSHHVLALSGAKKFPFSLYPWEINL